MNIKESSLREMCERDREFCDLLTFRSGWKWSRCGNRYLFPSHRIEWRNFSTSSLNATQGISPFVSWSSTAN